jgi:MYXO-CTERM domain-containing protein
MARQEGGQCSIAAMRHPLAWALGGFALFGFLRRRREASVSSVDPRADELRRKLAESRAIVEERDEFEGAELTVDLAEPAPEDPESRRRAVHDAARETVEQMRKR